jgi:hypothetical protein
MQNAIQSTFAHRHNPDGSWDAICRACFRTISHHKLEQQLAPDEHTHSCDPHDLSPLLQSKNQDWIRSH